MINAVVCQRLIDFLNQVFSLENIDTLARREEIACFHMRVCRLPNRDGPKPGQIGGGRSADVPLGRGVTPGGVRGSVLADRSEGSGQ